jgi:hypothetical protein
MKSNKSKNILIVFLIAIIVIMAIVICLLFTGKISLNNNNSTTITEKNNKTTNKVKNDDNESTNNVENNNNNNSKIYKQKMTISNSQLMNIYKNLISGLDEQSYYGIVDINGDGIYELITKTGTCEADYVFNFYTYDENITNNTFTYIGSISAGHTVLYKMNDNTLMAVRGHMGYENIVYYYLDNAWLIRSTENMSSRTVTEDSVYKTGDTLINLTEVSDESLFNNYK